MLAMAAQLEPQLHKVSGLVKEPHWRHEESEYGVGGEYLPSTADKHCRCLSLQ